MVIALFTMSPSECRFICKIMGARPICLMGLKLWKGPFVLLITSIHFPDIFSHACMCGICYVNDLWCLWPEVLVRDVYVFALVSLQDFSVLFWFILYCRIITSYWWEQNMLSYMLMTLVYNSQMLNVKLNCKHVCVWSIICCFCLMAVSSCGSILLLKYCLTRTLHQRDTQLQFS